MQVEYISVDPAMRSWMNAGRSYVPPVEIGEVMRAAGIGRVIDSRHPDFDVGDARVRRVRSAALRGLGRQRRDAGRHVACAGPGSSRGAGDQRPDRLLRAARRRAARARPDRRRLRRGRVGREHRRPDRAHQGMPRDRDRGRTGQVPLARRGARLRRGHRLQGGRPPRAAASDTRPTASTSSSTTSAARCWTQVLRAARARRARGHQRRRLPVQRDRGAAGTGQLHAAARARERR